MVFTIQPKVPIAKPKTANAEMGSNMIQQEAGMLEYILHDLDRMDRRSIISYSTQGTRYVVAGGVEVHDPRLTIFEIVHQKRGWH